MNGTFHSVSSPGRVSCGWETADRRQTCKCEQTKLSEDLDKHNSLFGKTELSCSSYADITRLISSIDLQRWTLLWEISSDLSLHHPEQAPANSDIEIYLIRQMLHIKHWYWYSLFRDINFLLSLTKLALTLLGGWLFLVHLDLLKYLYWWASAKEKEISC